MSFAKRYCASFCWAIAVALSVTLCTNSLLDQPQDQEQYMRGFPQRMMEALEGLTAALGRFFAHSGQIGLMKATVLHGLACRMDLRGLIPLSFRGLSTYLSLYKCAREFTPFDMERVRREIASRIETVDRQAPRDPRASISSTEFNHRLRGSIVRAARLGLHRSPRLSILDIGCGSGFFLSVCKYFGHDCTGTDLPPEQLARGMAQVYEELLRAQDCFQDCRILVVRPWQPLVLDRKFDMITSNLICFNEYPSGDRWSRSEWEFFLNDIKQYLVPGGRLFLEMNEQKAYGRLRWYDPETLAFFRGIATVEQNRVTYQAPV